MITLLGSLLGFFGALFPEIIKLFKDFHDKKHELAILDRQMELQKLGLSQRLEEIRTTADIAEAEAIYRTYNTGVHWVDALNGSVRPVLAYSFFILYASVKLIQINKAYEHLQTSYYDFLAIIWNIEDQAIFAGIISFYFGQRAMSKIRGKNSTL